MSLASQGNHVVVVHRLQINLEGVIGGRVVQLHRELVVDQGVLTGGYSGPGEFSLVMLAAALPAMALSGGLVLPVDELAADGRTRLDLLGEHGRDFGTAVVVTETLVEEHWIVCSAWVRSAGFALEIGEELTVPRVEVRTGEVGGATRAHAAMQIDSTRGGSYLVDAGAWLWNVVRVAALA